MASSLSVKEKDQPVTNALRIVVVSCETAWGSLTVLERANLGFGVMQVVLVLVKWLAIWYGAYWKMIGGRNSRLCQKYVGGSNPGWITFAQFSYVGILVWLESKIHKIKASSATSAITKLLSAMVDCRLLWMFASHNFRIANLTSPDLCAPHTSSTQSP